MKRIFILVLLACLMMVIGACSNSAEEPAASLKVAKQEATNAPSSDSTGADTANQETQQSETTENAKVVDIGVENEVSAVEVNLESGKEQGYDVKA